MACRSEERGQKARQDIISQASVEDTKVQLHLVDLSRSNDVHKFAKNFAQQSLKEEKLYCLVNNAGCMVNTRTENSYGYEVNQNYYYE